MMNEHSTVYHPDGNICSTNGSKIAVGVFGTINKNYAPMTGAMRPTVWRSY